VGQGVGPEFKPQHYKKKKRKEKKKKTSSICKNNIIQIALSS
jgi:hypothetical protein